MKWEVFVNLDGEVIIVNQGVSVLRVTLDGTKDEKIAHAKIVADKLNSPDRH